MSPVDAFITLMDARDALVSAMELQGTEGGKRARVQNLLPRYADKAKTMTAALPAAVIAAYGEVVSENNSETSGVPPDKMGVMEDILVGAKNLVTLAAYASKDRPFEDGDIPQATFVTAVTSIDDLLASAAEDTVAQSLRGTVQTATRKSRGYGRNENIRQLASVQRALDRERGWGEEVIN